MISWDVGNILGVKNMLGCGEYLRECLGVLEISLGVGNIFWCWEYLGVLGISCRVADIVGVVYHILACLGYFRIWGIPWDVLDISGISCGMGDILWNV